MGRKKIGVPSFVLERFMVYFDIVAENAKKQKEFFHA